MRKRKIGTSTKYTEIFDYKGYKIKIHLSSISPSIYKIFKVIGVQWWELRVSAHNDTTSYKITKLATDYIDQFPERLEAKLRQLQIAHSATKIY